MNFKKYFSILVLIIISKNINSMFFENENPEPEIFSYIKNADAAGLEIYLQNLTSPVDQIFNNQDKTPLQEAVTQYNFYIRKPRGQDIKKIIKLLLKYKSNLNAKPRRNSSPVEINEKVFQEIFDTDMNWGEYLASLSNSLPS